MPSRADVRRAAEWGARAVLVALLVAALWRSLGAPEHASRTVRVASRSLPLALRDATRDPAVHALDVTVDAPLGAADRRWLAALRDAGVTLSWRGDVAPLAIAAERRREPDAPVRVLLVSADSGAVVLADAAGVLDTVRTRGALSLDAGEVVGAVHAMAGATALRYDLPAPPPRRAVLVLGRAGWESKFVQAALAEAGWSVRARLPAAPGVAVSDADILPLDTARYDAVIALDSTASDLAPAVARFVAMGGGLVAAGGATTLDAWRALVPARAAERRPGRILLDVDSVGPADLPLRPLVALRDDALAIERQPAGVAVAIRRAGRGRVLSLGYDESWRWRMLGGTNGPAAHRVWWSRTTGLVAPARGASLSQPEAAPRAAMVASLGAPSAGAASSAAEDAERDPLPLVLLAAIAALLLAETASRRFRGAR